MKQVGAEEHQWSREGYSFSQTDCEVLTCKGTFELRPEGGEEASHTALWGETFQAEGPAGQRYRLEWWQVPRATGRPGRAGGRGGGGVGGRVRPSGRGRRMWTELLVCCGGRADGVRTVGFDGSDVTVLAGS